MQSKEHTEPLTCNSVTDCPTLSLAGAALFSSTGSPDSFCLMPVISPVWSLRQITGTGYYTSAWLVRSVEAACNFLEFKRRLFTSQSSSSLDLSICCVPCIYRSTQNKATKKGFYSITGSTPTCLQKESTLAMKEHSLLRTTTTSQLRSPRDLPWQRLDWKSSASLIPAADLLTRARAAREAGNPASSPRMRSCVWHLYDPERVSQPHTSPWLFIHRNSDLHGGFLFVCKFVSLQDRQINSFLVCIYLLKPTGQCLSVY